MTSLVASPRHALANMSTTTYLATLSDIAWLAGHEPRGELLVVIEPAEERLGRRLILSVGQDGVRLRVQHVEAALGSVRVQGMVGHLGDLGKIALADHEDARG